MVASGISGSQWIEVDAAALAHNLGLLRRVVGQGSELAMVVKANAYGHGLEQVAPLAAREVSWLAVHTAGEARAIRRLGLTTPVLVMGFIPPDDLHDLDRDVHVFVSTAEVLEWVGEYRQRSGIALPVHLKVDTGTHRQGFVAGELTAILARAAALGLEVVGVATHFANIEDTIEHHFAREQLTRFHDHVALVGRELGHQPRWVHAACSAAALLFREADFTLVRAGISAYGHWPSRETRLSWILEHGRDGVSLEPVLRWKARVGQLQPVAKGATVGYGRTWTALRDTTLAVLPVGYSDGFPRCLGNQARVAVAGQLAPVVGRVCMNIMMVDVTDAGSVAVGDEVLLLGRDGEVEVSAEELAGLAETINYELLARLSQAIPRRVVEGGGPR